MKNFTFENTIIIGILTVIVISIGVAFYTKKAIIPTIEDFNQSIPSVPITDAECAKLDEILKTDSLAYKLLQDYLKERDTIYATITCDPDIPEEFHFTLISDLLKESKEWQALFDYFLKRFDEILTISIPEEVPAICLSEFEIPEETIISGVIETDVVSPEETIISGVIETDVVETDVIDIKSKFSTTNTNWSTNFSEFFTSEFGIKCLIAGSVVTLTLIVGHLVIKYYFKTTYKAIFIALKKIIVKISIAIKNWLYNILF